MAPIVSRDYKERKKQEILDSALKCFARKGFETTTVDEICRESGVSKGSIYTYFSSKDELYIELMRHQTVASINGIKEALEGLNTAFDKLDFLFAIYDQDFSRIPTGEIIVNLEFKLYTSRHNEINAILSKMRQEYTVNHVKEIIEEGQRKGEINQNSSAQIYAEVFWTIIHGFLIQIIHKDYPFREMIQEMKAMFYERIKA
jgi:AcrR family transcriptional regulator